MKSLRRGLLCLLGRGLSLLWTWHPLLTCCAVFAPSANPLPSREKLRVGDHNRFAQAPRVRPTLECDPAGLHLSSASFWLV